MSVVHACAGQSRSLDNISPPYSIRDQSTLHSHSLKISFYYFVLGVPWSTRLPPPLDFVLSTSTHRSSILLIGLCPNHHRHLFVLIFLYPSWFLNFSDYFPCFSDTPQIEQIILMSLHSSLAYLPCSPSFAAIQDNTLDMCLKQCIYIATLCAQWKPLLRYI